MAGNSRYTCAELCPTSSNASSGQPNWPISGPRRSFDRGKFEIVSRAGLGAANRAGGELDHRMRGQTGRKPPRWYGAPHLLHCLISVQVDKVDGESHAEGVHRFTGDDPQTFSGRETTPSEQAFPARCTMIRDLHRASENGPPCEIQDFESRVEARPRVADDVVPNLTGEIHDKRFTPCLKGTPARRETFSCFACIVELPL